MAMTNNCTAVCSTVWLPHIIICQFRFVNYNVENLIHVWRRLLLTSESRQSLSPSICSPGNFVGGMLVECSLILKGFVFFSSTNTLTMENAAAVVYFAIKIAS